MHLRDVGQMQRVAGHRAENRGLELANQLELDLRRRGGAGAGPDGRDALHLRRAWRELTDRVDAHRKRHVRDIAGGSADAWPDATKRHAERVVHVFSGARVEQRLASGAAGAPVLHRRGWWRDAEIAVERFGGELAQLVLGEHRDAPPVLRIIELVEIDARDTGRQQLGAARAFDRDAFALALDLLDRSRALGQTQRPGRA